METRSRRAMAMLVSLALAMSCAPKSSTAPKPMLHAVNVRVTDAGGAPMVHAVVFAVGPVPEGGLLAFYTKDTDTSGTAHFSLAAGAWTVYTSMPRSSGPAQVAAGTGTVPPQGRPDSVLFRLNVADEGVAFGQVLLSGRTDLGLSTVGVYDLPIATLTLADGSWHLDGLPVGRWQAFAARTGFRDTAFALVVPAPGDTLLFKDPITLLPAPTP